jgi:hypothetical protein
MPPTPETSTPIRVILSPAFEIRQLGSIGAMMLLARRYCNGAVSNHMLRSDSLHPLTIQASDVAVVYLVLIAAQGLVPLRGHRRLSMTSKRSYG